MKTIKTLATAEPTSLSGGPEICLRRKLDAPLDILTPLSPASPHTDYKTRKARLTNSTNAARPLTALIFILTCCLHTAYAQVPQLLNYQGRVAVNGTNFTGSGQFKFALINNSQSISRTASGQATVSGGFLTIVTVIDGGAGYSTPPTVTATGGGGSGALLTAVLSGGSVTSVTVNNPGSGYTSLPAIQFSAPPATYASLWSNDRTSANGSQPAAAVSLPVTNGLYSLLLGDSTLGNMATLPPTLFTNSDVRVRVWFNDSINGFQQLSPDQRIAAVGYALMAGTASTVPDGSITSAKIASGAVGTAQLAPGISGLMSTQVPASTNIQTSANTAYILTNSSSTTITLPPNPVTGDRMHFSAGLGGLSIIASSGQSIIGDSFDTQAPLNVRQILMDSPGKYIVAECGEIQDGNSEYLVISTNYGVGWNHIPFGSSGSGNALAMSGSGTNLLACRNPGLLYLSTNYAEAWIPLGDLGERYWTCGSASGDGSVMIAATAMGEVLLTRNSGKSWQDKINPDGSGWAAVSISLDGSTILAVGYYALYLSTNSGVNWIVNSNLPPIFGYLKHGFEANSGRQVAAAWGSPVYTSTNFFAHWVRQSDLGSTDWRTVAISGDGTKILVGGPGIPLVSEDFGRTWRRESRLGVDVTAAALNLTGSLVATAHGPGVTVVRQNFKCQRLAGSPYSNIELIHSGGGVWSPVSYSGTFTVQ